MTAHQALPTGVRPDRYHSLDALRAAMMLLGLVLHAAASYAGEEIAVWPFQDRAGSPLIGPLLVYIHLFRMPTFFVMSGFFAAFLYLDRGASALIRNRLRRVLAPLVIFWLFGFPLTVAGFAFAREGGSSLPTVGQVAPDLRDPTLIHLWFLYYLLIFCAAAMLVANTIVRLPMGWRRRATEIFGTFLPGAWAPYFLALITAVTLYPMSAPWIDTSITLTPALHVLAAYGVFFAFGWLLFLRRELLGAFTRRYRSHLAMGAVSVFALLLIHLDTGPGSSKEAHLLGITLAALAIWLHVFGLIGWFMHRFHGLHPGLRYLADASYWMYLIHVPIVIWSAGILAPTALPALVKSSTVLFVTLAGCLVSYDLLVRATAVGALLNGRRYPRVSLRTLIPVGLSRADARGARSETGRIY